MNKYFKPLIEEFNDLRFAASSLAFSTLLSLIPFLVVVLAVFQSIGGLEQFYPKIESLLLSYLKEATGGTVTRFIKRSLTTVNSNTLGISGILLLLWTSLGLIKNIDFAFNKIWKIKLTKPLYKRLGLYWLILVSIPIALALFAGLKSLVIFEQSSGFYEAEVLFSISAGVFLSTLYKVIPHTQVLWAPAFISAAVASVCLSLVQNTFFWFAIRVFRQNKIYGSLASFPIFLIWLLVVWYVVLGGVAFCAYLQQKYFKRA